MRQEQSQPARERAIWFGPMSFRSAAVGLTINVVTPFLNGYLFIILFPLYGIELIAATILCAVGGRARQSGSGIIVALIGTALCFVLLPFLHQFAQT